MPTRARSGRLSWNIETTGTRTSALLKLNPNQITTITEPTNRERRSASRNWIIAFLSLGVLAVSCLIWIAVHSGDPGLYLCTGVLILVFIPWSLESVGWHLISHWRLYAPGEALLTIAHEMEWFQPKLLLGRRKNLSITAVRLAQLALLQDNLDAALKHALTASAIAEKDQCLGKFFSASVLAQCHFARQEWDRAYHQLEQAQHHYDRELGLAIYHGGRFERMRLGPLGSLRPEDADLGGKFRRLHIVNLYLLGCLHLDNDNLERAKECFDKACELRLSLADRAPLAAVLKEFSSGLIACKRGFDGEAKQCFEKALSLIPKHISSDYDEQAFIIEVCNQAISLHTDSEEMAVSSEAVLNRLRPNASSERILHLASQKIPLR